MSQRLYDYFVQESTEYLDQLEAVLARSGPPDLHQFLRLATGVRGSAQMADAAAVADVAERLEDAARAVVANAIGWSEEIRARALETVADLKQLVRAQSHWGEAEERRVREAIARWSEPDDALPLLASAPDAQPPIVSITELLYEDAEDDFPGDRGAGEAEPARDTAAEPAAARASMAIGNAVGAGGPEVTAVPIQTLLLRGDDALREALRLRPEIERAAAGEADSRQRALELVTELFDLIELGLQENGPGA